MVKEIEQPKACQIKSDDIKTTLERVVFSLSGNPARRKGVFKAYQPSPKGGVE